MTARRKSGRGIGALLILCLLMAVAVALEMRYPDVLVRDIRPAGDGTAVARDFEIDPTGEPDRYRPPGDDEFSVIEQRPLFSPDRRPPEDNSGEVADEAATPATLDGLVLTGIIGAGDRRIAIVEPAGPSRPGSEALLLGVGDELRGWTVSEIEADRILLVTGTQRYYMTLIEDPGRRSRGQQRKPGSAVGGVRVPNVPAQLQQPQSQQPASQPQR